VPGGNRLPSDEELMVWALENPRVAERGREEAEGVAAMAAMVRVTSDSLSAGSPQDEQKRLFSDSSPPQDAHFLIDVDHLTMRRRMVGDRVLGGGLTMTRCPPGFVRPRPRVRPY